MDPIRLTANATGYIFSITLRYILGTIAALEPLQLCSHCSFGTNIALEPLVALEPLQLWNHYNIRTISFKTRIAG